MEDDQMTRSEMYNFQGSWVSPVTISAGSRLREGVNSLIMERVYRAMWMPAHESMRHSVNTSVEEALIGSMPSDALLHWMRPMMPRGAV
jgi:hypothetical protein